MFKDYYVSNYDTIYSFCKQLIIAEFSKAQGKGRPIVIGTCYKFPHCNQTCVESDFSGVKCVPLPPPGINFVCVCYPKS